MDLSVLNSATQPIPSHAYAAVLALLLGAIQFSLPKRGVLHKSMGYAWMASMAYVAVSAFFIHELRLIGPFSPIHLLSIFTLWGIYSSITAARRGDIERHRIINIQLYVFALLVAGAFTFFPGRIMYRVLFGA